MNPRRNLLPLLGLAVCVMAFFAYFLVFAQFPVTRDVPWASWLLLALGLGLVGVGLARAYRQPERWRGRVLAPIVAVLSVAVAGFFLFLTTVGSRQLPASPVAPRVGTMAPDFVLPDEQGRDIRLADLLGREAGGSGPPSWAVLIFYRGYW